MEHTRIRDKYKDKITNKQVERIKSETIDLLNIERLGDYKELFENIISRYQKKIKESNNEREKEEIYSNILRIRVFINCLINLLQKTKHLSEYEDFYIDIFIRQLIDMIENDTAGEFEIDSANKEITSLSFLLNVYPQILNTFSGIEEIRCDGEQEHVNNLLEMAIPYCGVLQGHKINEEGKNVLILKFIPTDTGHSVTKRIGSSWGMIEGIGYWHVDSGTRNKPMPSYNALSPESNFDFERIPHVIITKGGIRLFLGGYLALISEQGKLFKNRFGKEEMKKEMLDSGFYDEDSADRICNLLTKYYYIVDIPFK